MSDPRKFKAPYSPKERIRQEADRLEATPPSCPSSAAPRYDLRWLQRRKDFRGGSLLVILRPARLLERLASSPHHSLPHQQVRRLTTEFAQVCVSPNQRVPSLHGPAMPCRGRSCTCEYVEARRLHIGICVLPPRRFIYTARVKPLFRHVLLQLFLAFLLYFSSASSWCFAFFVYGWSSPNVF